MNEPCPTLPGQELLAVVREGHAPEVSFREVYDTYFGFVWRAVANRGVPDSALDDVVQEVFLVVHRKLPEFEGRSTLRTWLSGIVRRVVSDHVKKRGNQPTGLEPLSEEDAGQSPDEPGLQFERRAAMKLVDELLAKMSDVQAEVFVLYELEQLTTREIAELTATNENTVQTRLKAARKVFQAGIERHQKAAAREGRGQA
jgi:RNA polymerase sigma-70 factor (ECF subfamily)